MSIQKKSLISTLKTAKKANAASDPKGEKVSSMRMLNNKKALTAKSVGFTKAITQKKIATNKAALYKSVVS